LGCCEHRLGLDLEPCQDIAHSRGVINPPPLGKLRAEQRAAKVFTPRLIERGQRHACRQ